MHSSSEMTLAGTHQIPHPCIDTSRFWAVLIGIDTYTSAPLRGCVNDANTMAQYLTEDLGVAEDHIQRLLSPSALSHTRNCLISTIIHGVQRLLSWFGVTICQIIDSQADSTSSDCTAPTRANIIDSLLCLSTDSRIKKGDNILVYFSGHGSKYLCSDHTPYGTGPSATGAIEALCPIDRDGVTVPDISDREFNAILTEISRTKGHRITVIMDCCYSSSLTRAMQRKERVRVIEPLPSGSIQDMFNAADKKLGNLPGYQTISRADWHVNMDSHVLLAACNEYECAEEVNGKEGYNGFFTQALISALKSLRLNDESTTYYRVLQSLPRKKHQNPVIAGKWKHARLWFQDSSDTSMGVRDEGVE